MNKIFSIFFLMLVQFSIKGQNKELIKVTVDFIYSNFSIYKPALQLNDSIFQLALYEHFQNKPRKDIVKIDHLFNLIHSYAGREPGDAIDRKVMQLEKSLYFTSIGLLSDKSKASAFLGYAKYELSDSDCKIIKDLEHAYLGLLFLELLLDFEDNYVTDHVYIQIQEYLKNNGDKIKEEYQKKSKLLLIQFKEHIK